MRLFTSSLSSLSGVIPNPTTTIVIDESRWVAAARDNVFFSISSGVLETSTDGGLTYPNSIAFTDTDRIIASWVYSNGNIVFATLDRRLYLADKDLNFVTEKYMQYTNGDQYALHTPANANYPGAYFTPIQYSMSINNNLGLWGVFGNIYTGASPSNIYFTEDNGDTLEIAYSFGQNPQHRDDGTPSGGPTGTWLGDPNSDFIVKKTRTLEYCEFNDKWYCVTGDHDNYGIYGETIWLEGTYSGGVWTWNLLDFGFHIPTVSRLKAGGVFFREIDGVIYIYWGNKVNGATAETEGIWRCVLSDFTDYSKHESVKKFGTLYKINAFTVNQNTGMVTGICAPDQGVSINLLLVKDWGHGDWAVKTYPDYQFRGIRPIKDEANPTYIVDTEFNDPEQPRSLILKPGSDLFDNV